MELSSSNIKKFLKFSYISRNGTFQPNLEKWKKLPRQKFLILQEKKPRKNFLYFQKKAFLIFRETETPKKVLMFQETETKLTYIWGSNVPSSKSKKNLLSKSCLYSREWNFLATSLKNVSYPLKCVKSPVSMDLFQ